MLKTIITVRNADNVQVYPHLTCSVNRRRCARVVKSVIQCFSERTVSAFWIKFCHFARDRDTFIMGWGGFYVGNSHRPSTFDVTLLIQAFKEQMSIIFSLFCFHFFGFSFKNITYICKYVTACVLCNIDHLLMIPLIPTLCSLLQVSGYQHPDRYLHGDGVCLRRRALWLHL